MLCRLLLGACLLCLCALRVLAAPPVLEIGNLQSQLLRAPVEFVRTEQRLTLEELQGSRHMAAFAPLHDRHVNQGISDHSYWVRARLYNSSSEAVSWVVHHETSYLDELLVHVFDTGAPPIVQRLSDRLPFAERPLAHRTLAFAHVTPAGAYTDIYLRLGYEPGKPDAVSLNLRLESAAAFAAGTNRENLLFGLFYGNTLCLLLLALLLVLMLRHRIYLHYVFLVLATTTVWLHLNGFGFQYLWPTAVWWHNEGFHIGFLAYAMLALQFSRSFLNTPLLQPGMDRLLRTLLWGGAAGILLRLAGVYLPVLYLGALYLALLSLLPIVGWLSWRKGLRMASWFTVAWMIYGGVLVLSLLSAYTTLLDWGMQPLVLTQVGTVVEGILLLAATGRVVANLEKERMLALRLANTDPLTGLGNRRFLSQRYEELRQGAAVTGQQWYFLLIDLDHFKRINDTWGHAAGDRVLKDFAGLLLQQSRAHDCAVRFGGEEFAVLLSAGSAEAACSYAERLRQAFADNATAYRGQSIAHTLSIGITPIRSTQGFPAERELVNRADAALYAAKGRGRNQVVYAGPDEGLLGTGGRYQWGMAE